MSYNCNVCLFTKTRYVGQTVMSGIVKVILCAAQMSPSSLVHVHIYFLYIAHYRFVICLLLSIYNQLLVKSGINISELFHWHNRKRNSDK